MKKTILFIHQSFPGQFVHIAKRLAQDGHNVAALALTPQAAVEGVTILQYQLVRKPLEALPPIMLETDSKLLRGESIAMAMTALKQQGFNPDVVFAHPGWGEALFVKTVWPETRLVIYAEWYYNPEGQEVGFDTEFSPLSDSGRMQLQLKNTPFLHALNDADLAISPTEWQKSRFPAWAQQKIQVLHEGLDLPRITLGLPKPIRIPDLSVEIKYGDPIVTFVARHLEPVRGFHIFMRALPRILSQRPDVNIFILGSDAGAAGSCGYGGVTSDNKSWRQILLEELGDKLDLKRVHFIGHLKYAAYLAVLRLSACHVYLTTPFILSWSFFEAAAIGIPIVASDTPPVKEFSHLEGVELVDFFDHAALGRKVLAVLKRPVLRTPNSLAEFDLSAVLPKLENMVLGDTTVSAPEGAKRGRRPKSPKPAAGEKKPEKIPAAKAAGQTAPKAAKEISGRKK